MSLPEGQHKILDSQQALDRAGIDPIVLGPKEGLSLINGTAPSAAVASLALHDAHELAILSQLLTALTSEALAANVEWAHPFLAQVRPHTSKSLKSNGTTNEGLELNSSLDAQHLRACSTASLKYANEDFQGHSPVVNSGPMKNASSLSSYCNEPMLSKRHRASST